MGILRTVGLIAPLACLLGACASGGVTSGASTSGTSSSGVAPPPIHTSATGAPSKSASSTPTPSVARGPRVDVTGTVITTPTCPNEPATAPCAGRPVAGAVVKASVGARRVGSTTSDARGRFTLSLPQGTVTFDVARPGGPATPTTRTIMVRPGMARVRLIVDSGIR